ncbi:very long chain fatty acid elongase 6-like [Diadema antillarum]|uniref:very long chain fatty acid elongase 6-like n=1 Tax=Diadema antillarum TaxID=105358 RepID=UPI003A87F6B8
MASALSDVLLMPLAIEEDFDSTHWHTWMQREGMIVYAVSTIIYLIVIFGVQRAMKNRPRFILRIPLALWNIGLSIFSILSAWRLNVATHQILSERGAAFHDLVCSARCFDAGKPAAFWLLAFALSKLVEYGDTLFVVLRKAKLIVLHWYHHVITYMISSYLFAYRNPTVFVMAMVNTYIHAIMYPYYALRILGVAVPKRVAMTITSIQIIQLLTGFLINVYAAWALLSGQPCEVDQLGVGLGLFGFGTVLILFINFFVHAYILRSPKKKPE